jgi:hypothetical protein
VDEEAESGGGEPLGIGMRGAREGRRLGRIVDAERGVLVGDGAGFFLLLGGGGGCGGKQ